jgi:hypothetical protein
MAIIQHDHMVEDLSPCAADKSLSDGVDVGSSPASPELRRRPDPVALRSHPGVEITAHLSVTKMDFSLHAATRAGAEDARGREALCKYILRPPLSQERLHLLPDGLAPARAPPYWQARELRHRPQAQTELFDA